jgi:hypothetical protein
MQQRRLKVVKILLENLLFLPASWLERVKFSSCHERASYFSIGVMFNGPSGL